MEYKEGIGLYGGTFDPVHNGHVRVAAIIKQMPFISDLWIHVNYKPHYKKPMLSFYLRKILAFSLDANIIDGEYNYTHQALRNLRKIYGRKMPIYYFVGKEWDICKFKNAEYVMRNCIVIPIPKIEISIRSTQIREMIRKGELLDGLCPDVVIRNIEANKHEISI